MAPTIHILQILSCQPTLSRRQQLYVSLLAASGQIDDLFDHHHQRLISRDKNVRKKVAVSSEVKNVINLDDYVCDSKDEDEVFCKLSASLCNLTVKALESLMKSIEEAKAQKAISSGDCCAASLIPYLFSLTSHLLLTRVSPPSTLAEKARDSSFPISISSILTCASSPAASLAHQATEFFTQEFLHLLDVSMGGGSTSDEYSLEIDQVCDNAPLVWVTSILAALTLPASQSSSSSIFNGSIAKVVEMLKMFIVQSLKPIPKEENQQDSPELMATPYSHIEMDDGTSSASSRKLELVELFSAVSLCAVKTLKLIFRSNLTASMLLSCSCDIVPFKKCTGDDTLLINDSLNPTCSDLIVSCTQYSRSGNNDRDGNDDFEVTSKQLSPPSSHWGPLFFSRVIVEQKVIEIQQHLQKFIDNSKDEIVQTYNAKNYEGRQEEDDDATQDSTRPSGRPSFRNHSELPAVAKDQWLIFGNNRKGSIFVAQYFATFEYLLWMMSEHSERLMSSGPCIQKDKGVGLKVTSSNAINRMDSGGKKQLSTIRGLYTNDTSVNHVDENEEIDNSITSSVNVSL